MIWKVSTGGGPTMGLAYDSGMIFASTATNATIVSLNATDGRIIWRSEVLGDPKVGYSIDAASPCMERLCNSRFRRTVFLQVLD